MAYPDQICRLL